MNSKQKWITGIGVFALAGWIAVVSDDVSVSVNDLMVLGLIVVTYVAVMFMVKKPAAPKV